MRRLCSLASWLDISDGLRGCLLTTGFMAVMVGNWLDVLGTRSQVIAAYGMSLGSFAAWWAWFVVRVLANMYRKQLGENRSVN